MSVVLSGSSDFFSAIPGMAFLLITLGILLPAGAAVAQDEIPDHQWHRETASAAIRQQVTPAVTVSSTSIEGPLLSSNISVQPWFDGNSVDFVITAPAGEITSGTLFVEELTVGDSNDALTSATVEPIIARQIPVSANHLGYVRGNRLVKVQAGIIVPGTSGQRLVSGRLQLAYASSIQIEDADQGTTRPTVAGPLREMLEKLVANPSDITRFAVPLESAPALADESPVAIGGHNDAVARFESNQNGFTQFSGADLAACGVDIGSVNASSVSVWSDGEEQPVHRSAGTDENRPVRADDLFMVYARDNDSTYTVTRDYWVRILDTEAKQMDYATGAARPGSVIPDAHYPALREVEKDVPPVLTKNDQFLTILGYRWVWWTWTPSPNAAGVLPGARGYDTSGSLTFDLPGLAETQTTSARMALHFYAHRWAMDNAPVPFRVELNGRPIGQVAVSEPAGMEHTIAVPTSALNPKGNILTLIPETAVTPGMPELCFDRMEIRYPRTYAMTTSSLEFTPPTARGGDVALNLDESGSTDVMVADMSGDMPRIVLSNGREIANNTRYFHTEGPEDRQYLAFTPDAIRRTKLEPVMRDIDLESPENCADLVVIAWPDFIADLQPWIANKVAKGHAVSVVDVFDIYDQFGYGHESPHAIRAFLRHAAVHWQGSTEGPAASSVVLVGDSTSAYRNEFRNDVINYVPTMRLKIDNDPFASDQWYVSLFGDDAFADALIGRFSVNSRADLRTLIRKQLDYETKPNPGPWHNTLGFVADHSEFEESVDRVMTHTVPPRFFLDRIMMSELPWVDNYYFPREIADARKAKVSPEATGRIRDMFNEGATVVTYFGHGSPNIWSNERMWFGGDSQNSDNLLLTNRDKLSIVINMTCNSGAIDYPQPRWNVCISEDFMRVENGGAIACFVPSGPGLTVQHERLMMEVGSILFDGDQQPLGQTFQLALWRYLADGNPEELARMYILLGDPLLMPHISAPIDTDSAGQTTAANWPGTVTLPPDIATGKRGGAYQFSTYDDLIKSGAVGTFTSATVALPIPSAHGDGARIVAFSSPADSATTAIESTFVPVSGLQGIRVVQWRRADPADEDATATLEFRLQNDTPIPVRGTRVQVYSATTGQLMGESEPANFQSFSESTVHVELEALAGFTPLEAKITDGPKQSEIFMSPPLAVVGLRPDELRDSIPPAIVDPRSLSIRYRESETEVLATVTGQVYVLAREPLSNLRIGLEDAAGVVAQDSIATVPAVKPGDNVRVSLSVKLPPEAPAHQYTIRFDPSGYYPEFSRYPTERIVLGTDHFADLAIGSITPSNSSPTDGETVFFDVNVGNQGDAQAEGVRVEGFRVTTSTALLELESQVTLEAPLLTIEPGTTETVRLRWDPFRNAGNNRLTFKARSIYEMPDSNLATNSKSIELKVDTKARLRRVKVGVLPLTAEDIKARQVRFMARVTNEGESAAHGLRVRFYSSAEMTDANYLGDAELERIDPGETRDVVFVYKPKPGEEDRPINISFEIVYKGSSQRVPMD